MAREKGTSKFAGTFEIQAGAAIDPRTVVDTVAELTDIATWPTNSTKTIVYIYNGMTVSVTSTNETYMLIDKSKYTSLSEGWKRITGGDHTHNYIPLSGTAALGGSIIPSEDDTHDLGSSSKIFGDVYARMFHGDLFGHATNATNITVADANPSDPTTYYPLFTTETAGDNKSVYANYTESGYKISTYKAISGSTNGITNLILGNAGGPSGIGKKSGVLTLYGNKFYSRFAKAKNIR